MEQTNSQSPGNSSCRLLTCQAIVSPTFRQALGLLYLAKHMGDVLYIFQFTLLSNTKQSSIPVLCQSLSVSFQFLAYRKEGPRDGGGKFVPQSPSHTVSEGHELCVAAHLRKSGKIWGVVPPWRPEQAGWRELYTLCHLKEAHF